jgi:hypothetical protein
MKNDQKDQVPAQVKAEEKESSDIFLKNEVSSQSSEGDFQQNQNENSPANAGIPSWCFGGCV